MPASSSARLTRLTSVLWWLPVVLAGTLGAVGATTRSAASDPIGACSTTTGVIVVVDFSHWGGNVERGCDATLTTGYAALHAAGFTTAGDVQDGPAFMCRIDKDPNPSEEDCKDTPPADASWSYWHADAGQNTWSYSELGAMSYNPLPGSADAWTFGKAGEEPSFSPGQVRATNPGPPPTTTPTTRPAHTTTPPTTVSRSEATQPTSTVAPSTTAPPSPAPPASSVPGTTAGTTVHPSGSASTGADGGTTPTTTAKVGASANGHSTSTTAPSKQAASSTSTGGASAATTGTGGTRSSRPAPRIVDVGPVAAGPASASGSGGSPTPTLIAVSVVGVLAAGGGATAWRRRRRTD